MHLGLDLGTSGLKALLIDDNQSILAEAFYALTSSRLNAGWSEQNPSDWIEAIETVLDKLAQSHKLGALKSIGLSGHMHGATIIDKSDTVLRPCILWNDTRSHLEASLLDDDPQFREVTGNIVFPGFTAPKLAWVENNEPALFQNVHKVLLPKDYLRLWLTGEYASDMSDSAGTGWLDTGKRNWCENLLSKTNLHVDQMPRLVEGSTASGFLRDGLKDKYGITQNVIVAGGAGDNAASGIGVGAVNAGDAFASLGTSGVLFAACDTYSPDPASAIHTFCHALPQTWHQMGVILSATDSLNWFAKFVGENAASLTKSLGSLQAPGKTLFMPYLGGERTPHNDAGVRGAFVGLEHMTDMNAGTRAVLEGVVHAFHDSFTALTSTGTRMDRITAVGGGAKSEYWLQALATALNLSIDVPIAGDFGGALGAARLGMMSAGAGKDIIQRPEIAKTIEPNKDLVSAFSDAYERYRISYSAIKGLT